MITHDDAIKTLEGDVWEITPTDKERICISVSGFLGAKEEEYTSWDGSKIKAQGYKFVNETDGSEQLAAVDGGVIMCYEGLTPDGRKRSEVIKEYLDQHKMAAKTLGGVQNLVSFLNKVTVKDDGKSDVYTTDTGFVAKKILGAPSKDEIKAGQMIVGQKVASTLQAYKVGPGVEFEGTDGTSSAQIAGKDGAWIIKAKDEILPRMIQNAEFRQAYRITKTPGISARAMEQTRGQ